MKNIPVFTISLDFELYWGIFDKVPLEYRTEYFANTRRIIPELLSIFESNQIHVTWATVGMLFNSNWEEWTATLPELVPSYANSKLSAYHLIEKFGRNNSLNKYFFAPELIAQIQNTSFQELASHTYSHYYCNEAGQLIEEFRQDLKAAQKLALRSGQTLSSLVFPRNQYNESYLKVCLEEGIKTVRSNPKDWFWNTSTPDDMPRKLFRTGDAYFPLGKKTYFQFSTLTIKDGIPLAIPASRLLRPVHKSPILNKLRRDRIKSEMTEAAKSGSCYHLWWHPHNFGTQPDRSIAELKLILQHYKYLQETYGMQSMTMLEIYNYLKSTGS
jgi:peptidoglycan/xylan/chitin deacetylase (PgdA/CDA1 family)